MDETTIGARLRTLRRWRGKTQTELAGLAGLSPSFLSMVETGQRPLDRRSHIAALASALQVSETDLVGGPHLSRDRVQSDPHMAIPPLRVALQTNTLTRPAVDQARPVAELHSEVFGTIEPLRRVCDYVQVGQLLPSVIDELYRHIAGPEDEAARRLALETLVEACVIAAAVTKELNTWQCFSPTNVNIWRVTVGVERGESGRAVLDIASDVNLDLLEPKASRRAGFLVDTARGLAREPQTRAQAVRWLRQAESVAPQRVRNSTTARETVAYLLNQAVAEAGGRELRGMAARMGVPH